MENKTMKNIFKVTALACLMAAALNAVAGPSANVQVKGTVVQGACTPVLANSGTIDLGEISPTQLPATGALAISAKNISATVTCSSPQKVIFSVTDNRHGAFPATATNQYCQFGMGQTADGKAIGYYEIRPNTAVGDGTAGDLLKSANKTSWSKMSGPYRINDTNEYFTYAQTGTTIPKAITNISLNLNVAPYIDSEMRNASDLVTLDGNTTLNLEYQ